MRSITIRAKVHIVCAITYNNTLRIPYQYRIRSIQICDMEHIGSTPEPESFLPTMYLSTNPIFKTKLPLYYSNIPLAPILLPCRRMNENQLDKECGFWRSLEGEQEIKFVAEIKSKDEQ